jgi:hypothetical protein
MDTEVRTHGRAWRRQYRLHYNLWEVRVTRQLVPTDPVVVNLACFLCQHKLVFPLVAVPWEAECLCLRLKRSRDCVPHYVIFRNSTRDVNPYPHVGDPVQHTGLRQDLDQWFPKWAALTPWAPASALFARLGQTLGNWRHFIKLHPSR